DCSNICGDVSVLFPFGIGPPTCYLPGFDLTCDKSHHPARLMLGTSRVMNISLLNNTMHILNTDQVLHLYAGMPGRHIGDFKNMGVGDEVPYSLSTNNELILIGCGVQSQLLGAMSNRAWPILSGCSSFCSSSENGTYEDTGLTVIGDNNDDDDLYCYGRGCCQARISMSRDGMPSGFWINWVDPNIGSDETLPPSYALIAQEGWFRKRQVSAQLRKWSNKDVSSPTLSPSLEVPMVLEWEILQLQQAASSSQPPTSVSSKQYLQCPGICKSKNSLCKPRNRGYTCHCIEGYDGNPYRINGCTGYRCLYISGMNVTIGVASGFSIVLIVLGAFVISKKLKHRRAQIRKRKFFMQNRGKLLQQLVSLKSDIAERMIISLEELEKATNNFDKSRELGGGGHGTVYKGILSDLHVVAIKKPKKVVQKEKEICEFINEVAILSQINHRNVVKLYGCCLETEVPMLVYKFISSGTLYEHLHGERSKSLSWDDRLRIAVEASKSLAYLHSAASTPVIHRDIKSANILLDDSLTTKVADFGASRYISTDISGVMTKAQGTRGYWDPMYFRTGRLTEKSNVYSFGVVLLELLTRKK
ncbi:wall-associated receptor kinase 2-like, partial [Triticum dicoccoides]